MKHVIPRTVKQSGPLASVRAAADLCGQSEGKILMLVHIGKVKAERIGKKLYVDLDDVDAALAGEVTE